MMEGMDTLHPFHEHLASIEAYVDSATKLTGQLLGFARGGKYNVQPTDMNQILRHQSQLFGRTRKEIKMVGRFQEDLWAVDVDRGQMVQVLLNLFVNAGQAMPEGGTLTIDVESEVGQTVVFTVSATDNVGVVETGVTVNGESLSLDADGMATYTSSEVGVFKALRGRVESSVNAKPERPGVTVVPGIFFANTMHWWSILLRRAAALRATVG